MTATPNSTPADALPQLDARSLVDGERLEAQVKDMYRQVARGDEKGLHFEVGRDLAERLGYPSALLDAIPADALSSFAGVGYHLDMAALQPGDRVLDLGSGSGTDVFCAAVLVGVGGSVVGVEMTDEQLAKAATLRDRHGFTQVEFVESHIEELPFDDASFDVVISNGVINLSPVKDRVFAEAARVLRPGGRLVIADIVSGRELKERTRRNVELWAACVAGAIPRGRYLEALRAHGLQPTKERPNNYTFISDRALDACSTYEVESVSFVASKSDSVSIPARFNGPLESGNGGYSSGAFAGLIDGPAEVSLRLPVPLDTRLDVVHDADGSVRVLDRDALVAEAHPADELEISVPAPVSVADARHAAEGYRGLDHGIFCQCFVCGRAREDSLEVFPGAVDGRQVVASPWTPPSWAADADGHVHPEIVWGVLDCPTYFALHIEGELTLAMLARFNARIDKPIVAGREHVVIAWPIEIDGRKRHGGAAVMSADGEVLAVARALLIEPRAGSVTN